MWKKLALALCSTLTALFLFELFLRLFLPQKTYQSLADSKVNCYVSHPVYYVGLKPNTDCTYGKGNTEYPVRTHSNNLGFREDSKTTVEKEPGQTRIVFIGDSLTFGQGVKTQEAFPKQVEKMLKQQNIPSETINASIIGSGLDWYYLTLKERILPLKPDSVVIGFYLGNDLSDLDYFTWKEIDNDGLPQKLTTPYEYIDADGSRRFANTPKRYRVLVLRDLHSFIFLTEKVAGLPDIATEIAFTGSVCMLNPDCSELDQQIIKAQTLFQGMKKLAAKHNITLIVAILPWELQLSRNLTRLSQSSVVVSSKEKRHFLSDRFVTFFTEQQIRYVDVLEAFDAYQGNKQVFYPIDKHWTKEGHRIAAEAISQALIKGMQTVRASKAAETAQ